jgi:hypothetical protein
MSLDDVENKDNFLKKIKNNYVNSLIRKDHIYAIDSNSYMKSIQDFTKKYSIFNNIEVIQLHPSAENGYPHTRPNTICIPSTARFPSLKTTLFHEAIHIHQRNNKKLWDSFLLKEGWTPISESEIPSRWIEKCRMNPDTIYERFYCFEKRYVPIPLLIKDHNVRFEDIKVMFYDLETGILEHNPPDAFIKKYGSNRQSEHPYEIYAVIMEDKILSNDDILSFIKNR